MKNLILLMFIFLSGTLAFGKKDINYQSRSLEKKISKAAGIKPAVFKNLDITEDAEYIQGKFFAISHETSPNPAAYAYIGRVNCCRAGGCSIERKVSKDEEYEFFDYFVVFDLAGTVLSVKVFDYQATHGYEITSRGWLKQFIGYSDESNLEVGKNIDAISGATISVHALTFDIKEKTTYLTNVLKQPVE